MNHVAGYGVSVFKYLAKKFRNLFKNESPDEYKVQVAVEEYDPFRPVRLGASPHAIPTRFTETTIFPLLSSPIIARHHIGSLATHQFDSKAVWHRLNRAVLRNQNPPSNKRKLASIPNELD